MQKRSIGQTGIELSEIGFGLWTLAAGWWGTYSKDEQIALVRAGFDNGITFFNTAPVYGEDSWGEKLFAEALGDVREQVVVGTTFGYDLGAPRSDAGHRERPHDWTPDGIRRSVEQSLTNLGVDRIDIWQLHNPKMDAADNDALWDAIAQIKAEGLVGAVGPSMGPRIGWRDEGVRIITERPIDFVHHIYNMLEQDPGREFTELAAERDIAVLVRVPHSSGILEDNLDLDTHFDETDHRSHRNRAWLEEGLQKIEQLRFLQEDRDASMGQIALAWLLADPAITSVQPNFYNLEQVIEYAKATDIDPFDADELGDIGALYAENFGVELAETAASGVAAQS